MQCTERVVSYWIKGHGSVLAITFLPRTFSFQQKTFDQIVSVYPKDNSVLVKIRATFSSLKLCSILRLCCGTAQLSGSVCSNESSY